MFADASSLGNNVGQIAPTTFLTASATGSITGYFFREGWRRGFRTRFGMVDVTANRTSALFFPNQTTAVKQRLRTSVLSLKAMSSFLN